MTAAITTTPLTGKRVRLTAEADFTYDEWDQTIRELWRAGYTPVHDEPTIDPDGREVWECLPVYAW